MYTQMYKNYHFINENQEILTGDDIIPVIADFNENSGVLDGNFVSPVEVVENENGRFIKLHHVTFIENVESIKENGLIPQIGELSQIIGETKEAVYLFPNEDSKETALRNWLGEVLEDIEEEREEEIELMYLEVHIPINEVPSIFEPSDVGYEFVAVKPIPSAYIKSYIEE